MVKEHSDLEALCDRNFDVEHHDLTSESFC